MIIHETKEILEAAEHSHYSQPTGKAQQDLRVIFSPCEAEDAGGLTPGKDDNEAGRKNNRKDAVVFKLVDYISALLPAQA